MLHNVLYNGSKIDELLESISHIKTVANGWVILESTEEYPTNLNELLNPGNFSTKYWVNSPSDITFSAPLKIIVSKEQILIRQYIFSTGYNKDGYTRTYNLNTNELSAWESIHLNTEIYVSDTSPSNPKNNNIWINTSNENAVIQYYDETLGEWMSLNPYDYMNSNIYKPNQIEFNNVFNYIDKRLQNLSGGDSSIDFYDHIKDTSIHVTLSEKDEFSTKMTSSNLLTAMQTMTEELNQYIAIKSSESGVDISSIEQLIANINKTLSDHINNTVLHPTQEQIDNWNNKSNKVHTHTIDEITIDASNVIGSLNIDNIPDDAKERQVNVSSEEELLALTINDVQNGDFIFINYSEDKNELVIVIDETKLGSREAFLSYSTPAEELKWENVQNKPTTIEELGITDMESNTQIDKIIDDATIKLTETQSLADTTVEKYSYSNDEQIKKSHTLETGIDNADYKLTELYQYTNFTEGILSKLEAIAQ